MENRDKRFIALTIVMVIIFVYEFILLSFDTQTGNLLALLLSLTNVLCLYSLYRILKNQEWNIIG
ncbi:hypothetical protein TFHFJT_370005 [Tenacibaculum finnmarkense]|nr:hypothetical protein TFHFJT_370005 [Tenacibaculum finnmarkense]